MILPATFLALGILGVAITILVIKFLEAKKAINELLSVIFQMQIIAYKKTQYTQEYSPQKMWL